MARTIRFLRRIILPNPKPELDLAGTKNLHLGLDDNRARFFEGHFNLGFFYRTSLPPAEDMYRSTFQVLKMMNQLCRSRGVPFALVYFPQIIQTQPQDWKTVCEWWNLSPEDFDLMRPNKRLKKFCRQEGIPYVDLTSHFRKAASKNNLYLRNDGHFNENGHKEAALGVAQFLRDKLNIKKIAKAAK